MDVSVIIVCMNRPDNLYPCLESIRRTTRKVAYEVLVVAYMYDPEGLARARKDFPWVTFIESNEIRGPCIRAAALRRGIYRYAEDHH